jgi:predicted metalloprotease with PDZ domain
MRGGRRRLSAFAIVFLWQAGGAEIRQAPAYLLTYEGPPSSQVRVEIEVPPLSATQVFVMPRAVPMGYEQEPYDRFLRNVRASSPDGKPLAVERENGPRWRVRGPGEIRRVIYEVDLARMERETPGADSSSKVREGYVGLLGYSVFGFLEGLEDRPQRLSVRAPAEWPVFTTLAPAAPPAKGSAAAEAADFYALADSQIMMGPKVAVAREKARVPLFVSIYDEGRLDAGGTRRLAAQALDALIDYFGQAPFPHYSVLVESLSPLDLEHRYGFSMEHLDSSTYFLDTEHGLPKMLPRSRSLGPSTTSRITSHTPGFPSAPSAKATFLSPGSSLP